MGVDALSVLATLSHTFALASLAWPGNLRCALCGVCPLAVELQSNLDRSGHAGAGFFDGCVGLAYLDACSA